MSSLIKDPVIEPTGYQEITKQKENLISERSERCLNQSFLFAFPTLCPQPAIFAATATQTDKKDTPKGV